jgi:hypothetical protein
MPVAVSSTSAADTGELVRQTSAMEINAQPWLESTHKVFDSFSKAFYLANSVSFMRFRR